MADQAAVGPELVFAVVSPVGTPDESVLESLENGLQGYGYELDHIKLSGLLQDDAITAGRAVPSDEAERVMFLIREGDEACARKGAAEEVALLAIRAIRDRRLDHHRGEGRDGEDEVLAERPVPRRAYLLDSLKRVAEVSVLREIYGDRLVLLGLRASLAARRDRLRTRLEASRSSAGAAALDVLVNELIDLDRKEPGDYGQDVQRTFPLADVFTDVEDNPTGEVGRLLKLLFGDPNYPPPTSAEYGMSVAALSSTRSPELGRKVGAALVKDDYTVVGQGANIDRRWPGSPALDHGQRDIRGLVLETLKQLSGHLDEPTRAALERDGESLARDLLDGALKAGGIVDLTEFQRPVHAEMTALLAALQNGASVTGATVYVTAEPCHNCTKHILALMLPVRYLSPYPKGRAAAMFGTKVEETFLPFDGIAPRRYQALFDVEEDRKTSMGVRLPWGPAERKVAEPRLNAFVEAGLSERENAALARGAATQDQTPSGAP